VVQYGKEDVALWSVVIRIVAAIEMEKGLDGVCLKREKFEFFS
jgi:hypothetical protein